jgi:uncharacterized protein
VGQYDCDRALEKNPLHYSQGHEWVAMKRDQVLAIVQAHQDELKQMGVKSLDLFGSVARDEARPDSDVDFLVELSRPMGLFQFLRIKPYLEDTLGCSVDLGTLDSLRQNLREPVLKDVMRVF